jgi:hypothetical protein
MKLSDHSIDFPEKLDKFYPRHGELPLGYSEDDGKSL